MIKDLELSKLVEPSVIITLKDIKAKLSELKDKQNEK